MIFSIAMGAEYLSNANWLNLFYYLQDYCRFESEMYPLEEFTENP